jgi:hypothetical protein
VPPRPSSVAPTPLRSPTPAGGAPITLPATPVGLARVEAPVVQPSVEPAPLWRDWYVYQADGRHIGPLSTETLARAWLNRQVPQGVCVGAAGDGRWWPLEAVSELMEAARALQAPGPASYSAP